MFFSCDFLHKYKPFEQGCEYLGYKNSYVYKNLTLKQFSKPSKVILKSNCMQMAKK